MERDLTEVVDCDMMGERGDVRERKRGYREGVERENRQLDLMGCSCCK